MDELNLTEFFLTALLAYGPLMLGLALLISAIGVPIPGTLLVVAGGAFAQQGVIDWRTAAILGLLGAVLGDTASYGMGRFAKNLVQRRFSNSSAWQIAQKKFNRRGGLATYLTRFLITPLAIPTNLIAGSSGYSFGRFMFYDVVGEITWIVIYGGLGYTFGSQWEVISQFMSDLSGLLGGIAILGIGLYFWFSYKKRREM